MKSFPFIPKNAADAFSVLNHIQGLTTLRLTKLFDKFGKNPLEVFRLSFGDILEAGLPQMVAMNMLSFKAEEFLLQEQNLLQQYKAQRITQADEQYPSLLKQIKGAPLSFYMKGELPSNIEQSISIVGTRAPSFYGIQIAQKLARELTQQGILVVSGMALGIDAAAHQGALKEGGKTVAVLGTGIDQIYPLQHQTLFEDIIKNGCVISEFPFGTKPHPANFPRRNRIVSGLSLGVVVVESFMRSGALITARFATEQGRDVFAVPGRIDQSLSLGPHYLIKQGAKLIESTEDILEELLLVIKKDVGIKKDVDIFTDEEQAIYHLLEKEACHIDCLIETLDFDVTAVYAALFSLQMKKKVRETAGKNYELYKANQ